MTNCVLGRRTKIEDHQQNVLQFAGQTHRLVDNSCPQHQQQTAAADTWLALWFMTRRRCPEVAFQVETNTCKRVNSRLRAFFLFPFQRFPSASDISALKSHRKSRAGCGRTRTAAYLFICFAFGFVKFTLKTRARSLKQTAPRVKFALLLLRTDCLHSRAHSHAARLQIRCARSQTSMHCRNTVWSACRISVVWGQKFTRQLQEMIKHGSF